MSKLDQIAYLKSIEKEILQYNHAYNQNARSTLIDFMGATKSLSWEEWGRWADALHECYNSAKLFYQLALLEKLGVLSLDLLYIMYYDEITGFLTEKLRHLIRSCGTGLDLAVNFNAYQMARESKELIDLIRRLDKLHEQNGADLKHEGHGLDIEDFEKKTDDFFDDPSKFDSLSENYVNNWVETPQSEDMQTNRKVDELCLKTGSLDNPCVPSEIGLSQKSLSPEPIVFRLMKNYELTFKIEGQPLIFHALDVPLGFIQVPLMLTNSAGTTLYAVEIIEGPAAAEDVGRLSAEVGWLRDHLLPDCSKLEAIMGYQAWFKPAKLEIGFKEVKGILAAKRFDKRAVWAIAACSGISAMEIGFEMSLRSQKE